MPPLPPSSSLGEPSKKNLHSTFTCPKLNISKNASFFLFSFLYETDETDDFVIKKISGFERKISSNFNISKITSNFLQVLADTLTKISKKFLCHVLAFQNIPSIFFIFPNKNLHFLIGEGSPLLEDMSVKGRLRDMSHKTSSFF